MGERSNRMGAADGAAKGKVSLLVCAAGVAVAVVALSFIFPTEARSGWAFALAAGALLLLSNLIHEDSNSLCLLSGCCACLGFFLGYGVRAMVDGIVLWQSLAGNAAVEAANTNIPVPAFLVLVSIFHIIEYSFVVCFHPQDTKFRALMLTPVPMGGYSIALIAGLIEYYAESRLWAMMPAFVGSVRLVLLVVGFTLSFLGWAFRSVALFTAKSNFTHLVSTRKERSHMLVKTGVYRLCRHPGYVGWFLWSVSTQLALGNPFCFLAYFYVSFKFFQSRIPGEEAYLVDFFGQDYLQYADQVPCGIPGISRYG